MSAANCIGILILGEERSSRPDISHTLCYSMVPLRGEWREDGLQSSLPEAGQLCTTFSEPKVGMCGRICNIMHWGRSEISIRKAYEIFNLFLRNSGAWLLINVNVSKAWIETRSCLWFEISGVYPSRYFVFVTTTTNLFNALAKQFKPLDSLLHSSLFILVFTPLLRRAMDTSNSEFGSK